MQIKQIKRHRKEWNENLVKIVRQIKKKVEVGTEVEVKVADWDRESK